MRALKISLRLKTSRAPKPAPVNAEAARIRLRQVCSNQALKADAVPARP